MESYVIHWYLRDKSLRSSKCLWNRESNNDNDNIWNKIMIHSLNRRLWEPLVCGYKDQKTVLALKFRLSWRMQRTHHGERAGVETVITCHRRPILAWEPVGHQGRFKFLLWNLFQASNALYSHKSQIITRNDLSLNKGGFTVVSRYKTNLLNMEETIKSTNQLLGMVFSSLSWSKLKGI